ncbi:hypothetical protein ACFXPX_04685 [Kitasatospora sp. NPDC059146]|uniref:hypothetical protein n=1 Tax=unclassified Kitasatospora TaxID=2633591 RepID=UPI0036BBAEE9
MQDTTTKLPDWYGLAEETYRARLQDEQTSTYQTVKWQVDAINDHLHRLGITPIRQAQVGQGLVLKPALLLEPDYDEGLYEVSATWDTTSGHVAVAVRGAEDRPSSAPRVGRALSGIGDVAEARCCGVPAPKPEPLNLRAIALGALTNPVNPDHISPEAHAIVEQLAGLTAAVLYAADTVSRSVSRP